jgi:hypothetical protein
MFYPVKTDRLKDGRTYWIVTFEAPEAPRETVTVTV